MSNQWIITIEQWLEQSGWKSLLNTDYAHVCANDLVAHASHFSIGSIVEYREGEFTKRQ